MVGWKLVGEKLHGIYTKCMQYECIVHDVCGRQWHIMLARVRKSCSIINNVFHLVWQV